MDCWIKNILFLGGVNELLDATVLLKIGLSKTRMELAKKNQTHSVQYLN